MFAPYFQTMLLYHEVASLFTNFPVILSTLLAAKTNRNWGRLKNTLAFFPKELSKHPTTWALPCLVLLIADQGHNLLSLVAAIAAEKKPFWPRQFHDASWFQRTHLTCILGELSKHSMNYLAWPYPPSFFSCHETTLHTTHFLKTWPCCIFQEDSQKIPKWQGFALPLAANTNQHNQLNRTNAHSSKGTAMTLLAWHSQSSVKNF